MGIEGQVKLGYRNELNNIADPDARKRRYDELVAQTAERGKAIHLGAAFGVDDVIDPAETRRWIVNGLRSVGGRTRTEVSRRNDIC